MGKYPICNHKKNTAPQLWGMTFILCWRCTGVMISLITMCIVGAILQVNFGIGQVFFGGLLLIPMIVDGLKHYFYNGDTSNRRRFITGMLFGVGYALVFFVFC